MVAQGIIAMALALPTGFLFGVGYGTGVRIGYEQVYPRLFPKGAPNSSDPTETIQALNRVYDTIGGKEASNMGIAVGLNNARSELENNPDFRYFEELELRLSGRTPSSLNPHSNSSTIPSSPQEEPLTSDDVTLDDIFTILNSINQMTSIDELRRMRIRHKDNPNIIQVIDGRIKQLNETQARKTIAEQNAETLANRELSVQTREATPTELSRAQYESKLVTLLQTWLKLKSEYTGNWQAYTRPTKNPRTGKIQEPNAVAFALRESKRLKPLANKAGQALMRFLKPRPRFQSILRNQHLNTRFYIS